MPVYNYPAVEEVKTEDQEFKVILSYTVSWRLAWAILTVSKQKSTYTLILYSFFLNIKEETFPNIILDQRSIEQGTRETAQKFKCLSATMRVGVQATEPHSGRSGTMSSCKRWGIPRVKAVS